MENPWLKLWDCDKLIKKLKIISKSILKKNNAEQLNYTKPNP
jgi:hypothetical protein